MSAARPPSIEVTRPRLEAERDRLVDEALDRVRHGQVGDEDAVGAVAVRRDEDLAAGVVRGVARLERRRRRSARGGRRPSASGRCPPARGSGSSRRRRPARSDRAAASARSAGGSDSSPRSRSPSTKPMKIWRPPWPITDSMSWKRAFASSPRGACDMKNDTSACATALDHPGRRRRQRPLARPELEPGLSARVLRRGRELGSFLDQRLVHDDEHALARLHPGRLDQVLAPRHASRRSIGLDRQGLVAVAAAFTIRARSTPRRPRRPPSSRAAPSP